MLRVTMREVTAGDRLDQYDLTELLARSGMASIFRAIDRSTGSQVAVKVPHMQYESDVAFFERFRREENIGQKLAHPNIVRVLQTPEKSRLYMVMELAEGQSLRAVLRDRRRLAAEQALDVARQIARALIYMHGQGVVHRDLKPDNVIIDAAGGVKLLDFGIAMDRDARRLTWFGLSQPLGTPDYMAPEQVRGKRGDVRTDVYALGTMLCEMLTGELPYDASNVHAMMRAKLNEEPRRPSEVMPSIDPHLEEIVLRAVARSPRERYATAAEMLADLENPSGTEPRDRSQGRPAPLIERIRIPRGVLGPFVLLLVIGLLLALTLSSGRASRRDARGPASSTASERSPTP